MVLLRSRSFAICVTPISGPHSPRWRRRRRAFCKDLLEPGASLGLRLRREPSLFLGRRAAGKRISFPVPHGKQIWLDAGGIVDRIPAKSI